jgi:hypothetical protein
MITGVGTTCDNEKMFYRKSFTDFAVSKDSIKVVEIADIVDHWCQRHQPSIYHRYPSMPPGLQS